jgi:hypothetical protein
MRETDGGWWWSGWWILMPSPPYLENAIKSTIYQNCSTNLLTPGPILDHRPSIIE